MAKVFPVKVVWRNEEGKTRTKGFDLLPRAEQYRLRLIKCGIAASVYAQGALFSGEELPKQSTYGPGDDIPY